MFFLLKGVLADKAIVMFSVNRKTGPMFQLFDIPKNIVGSSLFGCDIFLTNSFNLVDIFEFV